MRCVAVLLALAACSAPAAPPPPAPEPPQPCRIRPATVSDRDFLSPATLREIRRVNRELRRHCAG